MLHYNQSSIGSSEKKMQWCIKVSQEARGSDVTATKRLLKLKVQCNPTLDLIRLSIGDPTVYGNFTPPSSAVEAVQRQLGEESQSHRKGPPCGEEHTRPHTIATYMCHSCCHHSTMQAYVCSQPFYQCRSLVCS